MSLINIEEGPAYGAALIAGVAVGVYPDFRRATQAVRVVRRIRPRAKNARLYARLYREYRALYPALKGTFKALDIYDVYQSSV